MARTLVGLDIGSSGVRAAEFTLGRRKVTLRKFAELPLPQGVVRAGAVVDPDALTESLEALWKRGKFGTKTVALGIANAGVLVRQMDLEWMPPKDFRKALRYQVEDALPIPVDDANLDYHLLEEVEVETEGEASRKVARVLLVAASREMVDGFVESTHRAGLRTVSVDLLPFALIRARTPDLAPNSDEVEAIVDLGADTVSVVVHAGGVPQYVRMIPGLGGDAITEAVRNRYDWTWEDAERTKVYVGLPGHARLEPGQEVPTPVEDGLDHPAQRVVEGATQLLVEEISTTLDYYRSSAGALAHGRDVARVLLTGGASRLGGLTELLAQRLDTTVEQLDLNGHVKAPRRARPTEVESLVVPAGLCVGAVQ